MTTVSVDWSWECETQTEREDVCVCVTVTVMITVVPQIHHQCFFVFSSADALDAYCSLKASASNKFLRLNSKRLVRAFV